MKKRGAPLKRKTPLRTKRTPRKTLKAKADQLWREVVKAGGQCEAAGKDGYRCGGSIEACHIEGRKNHTLRFARLNGIAMCAGHHRLYTSRPAAWALFVAEHFPERWAFVREHINEAWDKDLPGAIEKLEEWRAQA